MAKKKKKESSRKTHRSKKLYTYLVNCNITLQYAFTEEEVEQAEEGGEGDVDPTENALSTLESTILEALGQDFAVRSVEASADFDNLLGIDKES